MDEFRRQAGILGESVRNPSKAAGSIVGASFHHATFSERIWANQAALKSELDKLLQTGMIQGKHPVELARTLRKSFDVSRYQAERLMRTELARVQTEAQRKSLEANGFEEFVFIALESGCEICREMDGKHFPVKKMLVSENAPPMHPHCRCSVAPYSDDDECEKWMNELIDMDEKINLSKEGVITSSQVDFYVGLNKKVLEAKYKQWIGDNKYSKLIREASTPEMKKYIRSAYRKTSFIGDGGTVAIREFEKATGLDCGRNNHNHSKKVSDLIRQIKKSLTTIENKGEKAYLENELKKLEDLDNDNV